MMSGKAIRIRGSGAIDMHCCMGTILATRPHCIYAWYAWYNNLYAYYWDNLQRGCNAQTI